MEYWKKVNADGTINTVESHSYPHKVPDAIQITKEEYEEFIASLPVVKPEPARNLASEIDKIKAKTADYDDLKARIETLEKK